MPRSKRCQVRAVVAAGVDGDDVALVGDADPHAASVRVLRPAALDAILVGDEGALVEAEARNRACRRRRAAAPPCRPARSRYRIRTRRRGRRRSAASGEQSDGARPLALQQQGAALDTRPRRLVRAGTEEAPFAAERQRAELVGQRLAVRQRSRRRAGRGAAARGRRPSSGTSRPQSIRPDRAGSAGRASRSRSRSRDRRPTSCRPDASISEAWPRDHHFSRLARGADDAGCAGNSPTARGSSATGRRSPYGRSAAPPSRRPR